MAAAASGGAGATVSSTSARTFLRKSQRVGSLGPAGEVLTHKNEERVFHSLDMPDKSKTARLEVKKALAEARHPILWNASTAVDAKMDRRSMSLYDHDHRRYIYNFRAETLPEPQKIEKDVFGRATRAIVMPHDHMRRTEEWPSQPALADKPLFRAGSVVTRKEIHKRTVDLTQKSRVSSLLATARILADSGYKTPYQRACTAPGSTALSGTLGSTTKHAHCLEEAAEEERRRNALFVPARSKTSLEALIITYRHEGAFEPVAAMHGEMAWSCCGAWAPDARGCLRTVKDPGRHCLDGFFRSS